MVCRFVGLDPGYCLVQGSLQKSNERLKKAEEKSGEEGNKKRKMIKFTKFTKIKKTISNEGPTYKAGHFLMNKEASFY